MLLPSNVFEEQLERKYKQDLSLVPIDNDIADVFQQIKDYIDIDVYIRLLSYIDMWDFDNFQRFFCVSLRKYYDENIEITDIESIRSDIILQVLCIVCIQYYFS